MEISCTPPEIREAAINAVNKLLPSKSKPIYDKEYNTFNSWCQANSIEAITENVLLTYYDAMSKTKKSSTLWSSYSMLRACLNVYKNLDISKFARPQGFLKRQSEGYQPKKSKILEGIEINRFIREADDLSYLAMKVILIMGYAGACRRDELCNMSITDLDVRDEMILVTIPKTKTHVPRLFVINEKELISLIQKYTNLRPKTANTQRFFLTYRNGRCIKSPIGTNKISQVPKTIASFLKLSNPEQYTGHCFRLSSAPHLSNTGGDLLTVKSHGGWKYSAVAEGYVETSLKKKIEVAQMISSSRTDSAQPSTSFSNNESIPSATFLGNDNYNRTIVNQNVPSIIINAKDTCTVNVHIHNCNTSGTTTPTTTTSNH